MMRLNRILILLLATSAIALHANEDSSVNISPAVERAIDRGLAALAKSQERDGCWSGRYGKNVGETSLCIMAFMSKGNLPGEGQYGDVVAKAVNWIIKQAKPNGLIEYDKQSRRAAVMYGHALSTLMLSEVWGQTRRQDVGKVLRKAVQLILQVQGPEGGWGYKSTPEDGDTSVCVMQIFALKSANEAGIHVPGAVITKALSLVKERFNEKGNVFGYRHPVVRLDHWGSSAAGTCIMHICNERDPKYIVKPRLKLIELMKDTKHSDHFYYFTYYGSVSCYYAGGQQYRAWKLAMEPRVLKAQTSSGSWGDGGYETAFAVLALALPYRYIPIYQH